MATPSKAKFPSVGINPNVPVPVQRELRKVADFAFKAQSRADAALAELPNKLSRNQQDLLHISQFVSGQVQANGAHPLNLTGLALGPTGIAPGTYTLSGGSTIQVGSDGRIIAIVP
jgi:hypothetical protein